MTFTYDAFISYRRGDGSRHAKALRRELLEFRFPRGFADPPGRKLTVYLDEVYERATEDFFENTIKPALAETRHLIVVRTPSTLDRLPDGRANWLEREIEYFRTLPQGRNISVALAAGEMTDPLPARLSADFENVEIVDVRAITRAWRPVSLRDEILKFIAALHDVPPARMPELRAEEARRRAARLRNLAVAAVVLAGVLASLAVWALFSRSAARAAEARERNERRTAVARQLAAEASLLRLQTGRELERSVLLAIESYRRHPTLDGEQALRASTSLLLRRVASRAGEGHVDAYAMRPDGVVAAAAPFGGAVTFRDTLTGRVVGTLPRALEARAIAFSPDSRIAAIRSPDGLVTLWPGAGDPRDAERIAAAAEGEEEKRMRRSRPSREQRLHSLASGGALLASCVVPGHGAIAVSAQGVVAGTDDERVHVVDCRTGRRLSTVEHARNVSELTFDASGDALATASWDGEARVWSGRDGTLRARLFHDDFVMAVAFSGDGALLATGSQDKTARLWETNGWRERLRIRHDLPLRGIGISPAGDLLVTLSDDLTGRVWDTARGREVARLPQDASGLGAAFHANGRTLVTWDYGGTVNTWDLFTRGRDTFRARLRESVKDLSFRHGDVVVAALQSGELALLDAASLRRLHGIAHPFFRASALSADGTVLAATSGAPAFRLKRTPHVVDTMSGATRTLERCQEPLSVSRTAVVCRTSETRRTDIVSLATGALLFTAATSSQVQAATFSDDGGRVAVAEYGAVTVYAVPRGNVIARVDGETAGAPIALNADGRYLATSDEGRIAVHDLQSPRVVVSVEQDGDVDALRFGPFSDVLATASDDRFARVIRLPGGAEVARIPHEDRVVAVAFDESGSRLATATSEGEVTVWNWAAEDLIARGCGLLNRRNLTAAEWQRYVGEPDLRPTCP